MATNVELPDYYETVAEDMLGFCGRSATRVWVDLGSGKGDVGLALLERLSACVMILVDPNMEALGLGLEQARQRGLDGRVTAVEAVAARLPMPDQAVDVVVSRGSFFFWDDPVAGLREVWRVLRPGGKAMIGGGLGSRYPGWARQEFIRRIRESVKDKPEEARRFAEARSPETFRHLAIEAGWPAFEVVGEGGLGPEEANAGIGIWLRITKEEPE